MDTAAQLAVAYYQLGYHGPAIQTLEKCHRLRPENTAIGYQLALMYLEKNSLDKAEKLFLEVAQKAQRRRVDCYYGLAQVFSERGDAKKSIYHLQMAMKHGFRDLVRIKKDKHMGTLRKSPGYKNLILN